MPIKKNLTRNANEEEVAAAAFTPAVEEEEKKEEEAKDDVVALVAVSNCLTNPARNRGSLISHTGRSLPHVASNPNRALIRPTSQ